MSETTTSSEMHPAAAGTVLPVRARVLVLALVGALLTGALALIAVRADALMIDLAKIGQAFCF